MLSSGSEDTNILNHDVRIKQHKVATLRGHSQQVCGLAWSPDGRSLASGGDDNEVCLWDSAQSGAAGTDCFFGIGTSSRCVRPRMRLKSHKAAVKALAWSPHQGHLLATGGATCDDSIKLWNTACGSSGDALVKSVDTGSQVSSLVWNPEHQELLSGHGYSQKKPLILWNAHTMTRRAELKGHTGSVLHLAASTDGSSVVSAGGDETLRYWNVFDEGRKRSSAGGCGRLQEGGCLSKGPKKGLTIR